MAEPISVANLPPEILIPIFVHLPVKDGCQLSVTCKRLYEIFQIEFIWEKKILHDFRINVKTPKEQHSKAEKSVTAFEFYKSILHKYGKLLGVWQRKSFGHYGSIFQVRMLSYLLCGAVSNKRACTIIILGFFSKKKTLNKT